MTFFSLNIEKKDVNSRFFSRFSWKSIAILGLLILLSHPLATHLQAQTFNNVPNLTFNKVYGTQDQLPQNFTISSTGADFTFNIVVVTDSGGSWLLLNSCYQTCSTPSTVTATINPNVTLAVGTYTGQLRVVSSDQSRIMVVSVTLNVTLPPVTIVGPANGSTSISLTPALTWTVPSGGADSYDVYLGTSPNPPFFITTASTSYRPSVLTSSTLYYWKVVAKVGSNSTAASSIISFRTGPVPTLLWQKDDTRQVTVWFMGGAQNSTYLSQNYVGATPGWTLRGSADFDRDGVPDLLWQNDSTRQVTVWFMGGPQGSTYLSQNYLGATPGWTLHGAADFNRDGVPDLIWQNDTTRQVTVWFMGGPQGSTYLSQDYIGATPDWTLCGAGDFDRDGVPDLIWQRDDTRQVTVWFMGGARGSTYLSQNYIGATPGWTLRGAADFDRDGVPDLLWQNDTTRQVTVWFMGGPQGSTYLSQNYIGATPGWMLDASQQ